MNDAFLKGEYVGDGQSLPHEVRGKLRHPPVYWAKIPPDLSSGSCSPLFWDNFCNHTPAGKVCPFLPCFWPHLIIFCCGPISCYKANSLTESAKEKYWIITDNELVRYSNGTLNAIPLTSPSLTNVTYNDGSDSETCFTVTQGCCLTTQAPKMILTPTNIVVSHHNNQSRLQTVNTPDDIFYGCPSEFHFKLLEARDRINGSVVTGTVISPMVTEAPITATMVSVSGQPSNNASVSERLQTLQGLKDQGLISQGEFDARRNDIISSV